MSKSEPEMRRPRLLIVEDDELLRKSLVRLFEKSYDIAQAVNGREAHERLIQGAFDVVLSDIHMPQVTGVEFLRLVRAHDIDVPVILMTGLPSIDTAIEAMNLGAFSYIRKPFDNVELKALLERATKLGHLARMKREALLIAGDGALSGDRAGLTASFDRALETLWVAFQPIVATHTQRTVAFEALMRCEEPTMPHPGAVLTAAERLGRLDELGRRVRERAAAAFKPPSSDAMLFVNLHSSDLNDPDLFSPMSPLVRHAEHVVLEVTERAALDDVNNIRNRVSLLRRIGYRIAIDDLGAGYAGLTSFASLEPEIVKLDMTLIRGIQESEVKSRVVDGITSLCRSLSMQVVAEGIETVEELERIRALGCDYLQGYLFGRPARELINGAKHPQRT